MARPRLPQPGKNWPWPFSQGAYAACNKKFGYGTPKMLLSRAHRKMFITSRNATRRRTIYFGIGDVRIFILLFEKGSSYIKRINTNTNLLIKRENAPQTIDRHSITYRRFLSNSYSFLKCAALVTGFTRRYLCNQALVLIRLVLNSASMFANLW